MAYKVQNGELSALEVTEFFLDRCNKINPKINAIINMSPFAIKKANEVDSSKNKKDLLLAGVPILIKDMLCTKGIPTTAGSKMLKDFIPPYSATVVELLEAEGAIIIGKCNQDEFAMGSSNESSYFGTTKNPWSLDRVTGGSSGGSVAAVAARLAPISIGTDTGGSIRQPANFCGVFGLKPTYGSVSRFGIVAYASSLDQAGPITRTVRDAELINKIVNKWDAKDATSVDEKTKMEIRSRATKNKKVGRIKNFFNNQVSLDVLKAIDTQCDILKRNGYEIVDIEFKYLNYAVETYYLLAMCEASSNLSRYDGIRFGYRSDFEGKSPQNIEDFYSRTRTEGFGMEVKRRIALGTYALSSGFYEDYFIQAAKVRRLIQNEFVEALSKVELLISPVTTQSAFKIGEKINDPLEMYNNDAFTTCVNLAGLPGASFPIGFDKNHLPIGMQLIGNFFEENNILKIAKILEKETNLSTEVPNV